MVSELCFRSASELSSDYRARRVSPVEVIDAVLARIEAVNPLVHAFFHVDADGARHAARASQARWASGTPLDALDGVPFSVKHHIATEGMPSPWGLPGPEGDAPGAFDAPIVARLKEAGAILLGKTTQPELAMFCSGINDRYGIARNPWDLSRTPGGSSSGAAAALAAGMGSLAIGSDGGGSIRIPAGYTGVVGHKPTFGRVPFFPPLGPGPVYGPLARCVEDIALVMNVITRPDWRDVFAWPADGHDYRGELGHEMKGLRVAYSEHFGYGMPVAGDVRALVRDSLEVLASLGAEVEEIAPFFDHDLYDALADATFTGLRGLATSLVGTNTQRLSPRVREILVRTEGVSLERYLAAKTHETQAMLHIAGVLKDYHLLATPTMPTTAYPAERAFPEGAALNTYGYTFVHNPFTWPFNMTLQPAISVPCGLTPDGLPAGLQIAAARGADALCIRAAHAFERARAAAPAWPRPGEG
jgi:aspartyl-tRNA(Asn)/glutamyl-tRNA(Gln) amidotransferase subunit A